MYRAPVTSTGTPTINSDRLNVQGSLDYIGTTGTNLQYVGNANTCTLTYASMGGVAIN